MIELDHISFWYPRRAEAALRDISLLINDGESVCVMGRNGSGKSTLVKLLAGLIKPDRGRITVDGRLQEGSTDGRVAILFQNPDNQMVTTQVEKEIAFALENRAVPPPEMEVAIDEIARQFGIQHLRQRLTSELSGGEKQRVALASVMVQKPSVLLLDEPDSFLDQTGHLILADELRRLHAGDPRLIEIRITQSAHVARQYKRLIVLDMGAVIADREPSALLTDQTLCVRAGLTVADSSSVHINIPSRLKDSREVLSGRLNTVRLQDVSFAWPLCPPVFEEVSLSLTSGETVGLIGATGAGKSSVGLLMAGLAAPDHGEVVYLDSGGLRLESDSIRGQLALVLQQPERQFFLENCAEEIGFGPKNLGRSLAQSEISEFFDMIGLNPSRYADRDPFTLSAGEKRRLAFAAVLSMAPSMILFDEPTAGLDGEGVGRFIALSKVLKSLKLGQVIISHDGDVIRRLCDRVLYLNGRRGLISLAVSELNTDPRFAGLLLDSTTPA